jgi:hypothetical protein
VISLKNMGDIRKESTTVVDAMKNGSMTHSKGAVIVKALNVFLSSAKLQLEYAKLTGKVEGIKVLNESRQ